MYIAAVEEKQQLIRPMQERARQILRVRRAPEPARSRGYPESHHRWLSGQAFGTAFLL